MKLRLEENVLRLRLAEAEVREFARAGQVACVMAFGPAPGQALRYALCCLPATDPAPVVRVRYAHGELAVEVPAALARYWVDTDTVGLTGSVALAENQILRIVVEKDLDRNH